MPIGITRRPEKCLEEISSRSERGGIESTGVASHKKTTCLLVWVQERKLFSGSFKTGCYMSIFQPSMVRRQMILEMCSTESVFTKVDLKTYNLSVLLFKFHEA